MIKLHIGSLPFDVDPGVYKLGDVLNRCKSAFKGARVPNGSVPDGLNPLGVT